MMSEDVRNGTDYENEFLHKKNIISHQYHYASFTAGKLQVPH